MSVLVSVSYLVMVGLSGYVALCAMFGPGRRHWAEIGGFSFAAGAGIWGAILFMTSLAGFVPGRMLLISVGAITVGGMCVLRSRHHLLRATVPGALRNDWDNYSMLAGLAIVIVGLTIANIAAEALTPGLADVDSYAIWMFKAKIIASEPLRPVPSALLDPALSFSHQDYPPGFPLIVAGTYAAVGAVDVQLGKIVLLPIYLSLVAVVYSALRRRLRRGHAVVITAVFATSPVLRQQAGLAVAEVFLVLMHACCLVLLLEWMTGGGRRNLIAAGAFAAFAAFAKNEGLALLPVFAGAAVVFAVARKNSRLVSDTFISIGTAVAIIMPWLIYRQFLPHTHEDYGGKLTSFSTILNDVPRLKILLPEYLYRLGQFNTAGGIWLLLIIAGIVGWRAFGRLPVLILWFVLLVHLGLYAATFMVTPWQLDVLIPMITAKLLMHIAPLAALLVGLHVREFLADDRAIAT